MATITLITKAGNGRRKEVKIEISEHEATDPVARAAMVSRVTAQQINRVVNWKIDI